MLKLILQYFGHLMGRADSLEKTLMLGKIKSKRRRGWQRLRWLDNITDSMNINLKKLLEIVEDRGAWCATVNGLQKARHDLVTEQQQQQQPSSFVTLFYIAAPVPSELNNTGLHFLSKNLWEQLILERKCGIFTVYL